ncbi:TonB family protein [Pseudocolwellia sp. HL-MZ19]|uniref:energy transducer TonB n=1 Tax=unclassified Pseudocolwellia TaxID=2848178 RepID=UPI003CEB294B
MSTEKGRDQFDKDIDALYSQRKNTIHAPKINFTEKPIKPKLRMKEMFSILTLGGVASFGIFAVINHFAYLPDQATKQDVTAMVFVDTIELERFDKDNQAINMKREHKALKEKQILEQQPERSFDLNAAIQVKPQPAKAITLDSSKVSKIALIPNALEHEVIQPTFKVMPSLNRVLTTHQGGRVKLAYNITKEGKVKNIKIIQSNVPRDLEKSAKKALSQWRYPQPTVKEGNQQANEELQVEFKFND